MGKDCLLNTTPGSGEFRTKKGGMGGMAVNHPDPSQLIQQGGMADRRQQSPVREHSRPNRIGQAGKQPGR